MCACVLKVLCELDVRAGPEVTDAEPPSEEVVGNSGQQNWWQA